MDGAIRGSSSADLALPAMTEQAFDALEIEIAELWGHISAAMFRFFELVAEFDRNEGWARHGAVNCAQWLNWKCGIGPGAAREKVRVARALEGLPKTREAFRLGRISYSKARAITRVATPAMEDTLLNVALHGTASQLERLVRKFRWVESMDPERSANPRHRARYVHSCRDEDGSMLIFAKLPPETGAMVERAIEAAMEHDGETGVDVPAETSTVEPDDDPVGARRADGLCHVAEHFLACSAERHASSSDRYQVVVHIAQALLSRRGNSGHAGAGDGLEPACCELEDGAALAVDTARRLGCDGTLIGILEDKGGEPLNVGRKTRAISPALRRALNARDGGCRFPGCDRTRFVDGHHVRHWADGGETKLPNLVTLCRFHHRLVHEGGFGLCATGNGLFEFTRPDGSRLEVSGSVDRRFRGDALQRLNKACGIRVDRTTLAPGWNGDSLDYDLAITSLYGAKYPEGLPAPDANAQSARTETANP